MEVKVRLQILGMISSVLKFVQIVKVVLISLRTHRYKCTTELDYDTANVSTCQNSHNKHTHTEKMWSSVQHCRWQLCETGVNSSPGTRLMPTHPHSLSLSLTHTHTHTHTHTQTHTHTNTQWERERWWDASCYPGDLHCCKDPWKESDIKRRCVCMCVCRWAGPPRGEAMAGILIKLRDRTGDQCMILATYHTQLKSNSIHNQWTCTKVNTTHEYASPSGY